MNPTISKPEQMKKLLSESREMLPLMVELAYIEAKQKRAMYLAYVAEGFTEQQAIDLCRPKA